MAVIPDQIKVQGHKQGMPLDPIHACHQIYTQSRPGQGRLIVNGHSRHVEFQVEEDTWKRIQ